MAALSHYAQKRCRNSAQPYTERKAPFFLSTLFSQFPRWLDIGKTNTVNSGGLFREMLSNLHTFGVTIRLLMLSRTDEKHHGGTTAKPLASCKLCKPSTSSSRLTSGLSIPFSTTSHPPVRVSLPWPKYPGPFPNHQCPSHHILTPVRADGLRGPAVLYHAGVDVPVGRG